jgi:hypothetical protein
VTACAASLPLAACGGGDKQDADEPSGNFSVQVTRASFPKQQRLAKTALMAIAVRNVGKDDLPTVAVTLRSGGGGSGAPGAGVDAFSYRSTETGLQDPTRPIWIVDRGPRQVMSQGPGGGVTAYVGTWALGTLKPGQTKTFLWAVTPVRTGNYRVGWTVSAGLNGTARAKLPNGRIPRGGFPVSIDGTPAQTQVTESGQIVTTPQPSSGQ